MKANEKTPQDEEGKKEGRAIDQVRMISEYKDWHRIVPPDRKRKIITFGVGILGVMRRVSKDKITALVLSFQRKICLSVMRTVTRKLFILLAIIWDEKVKNSTKVYI